MWGNYVLRHLLPLNWQNYYLWLIRHSRMKKWSPTAKGYCWSCETCELTSSLRLSPAPLIPLPIIETPLEWTGLDLVGPLPKSAHSHQYILVILGYAHRYPEVGSLRVATSKAITREMVNLTRQVDIPQEILTPFMSKVIAGVCHLPCIQHIHVCISSHTRTIQN